MFKSVCALGFFDGVHKAHSHILTKCVSYAKEHGLKSIALTFEKSPAEYFGKQIKYLTSLSKKEELMKGLGIDRVVVLPCTDDILSLSPEEFIDRILAGELNACAIFCGFNYTFGKNASGDVSVLKELCRKKNIEVFVSPCMTDCGVNISSSAIRSALSEGDIDLANSLLSRPYEICGSVRKGKKLGRRLNFPTANIYPENLPSLPHGVYATKTVIDNKEYISVTNIGTNPTVGDGNLRVETYIINFSGDIYGKEISVKFYKFLRGEKKFSSVEDLKNQIEKDKEGSISFFGQ